MPKKIVFSDLQKEQICIAYSLPENSTRDVARMFSVSQNTINSVLKSQGIIVDASLKISAKMKGRAGVRLGARHTEIARLKMSIAKKGRKPTTQGKIYTDSERLSISNGLKAHYQKRGCQSAEERAVISKARSKCKGMLRRLLKATGSKKCTKTYAALGYTERDLIDWIQRQFRPGMSWTDRESFHIDHIKPIAAFLREGVSDPKVINALENLQPLFPHENRTKSDSFAPQMRGQCLTARFGKKTTYENGLNS